MKMLLTTLTLFLSGSAALAGTTPAQQEQPAAQKPVPVQQAKPAPVQQAKPAPKPAPVQQAKPAPVVQQNTNARAARNITRAQFLRQARLNRLARIARRNANR